MKRLLIIQPYVPSYRVPFFRDLRDVLHTNGFELILAAGQPPRALSDRGDNCTEQAADIMVSERTFRLGQKSLLLRDVKSVVEQVRPDLIIAEQAVKNLENLSLLAHRDSRRSPRVALWGQGRSFSTSQGPVLTWAKTWLTRRSDWFFAYTEEGANYVVEQGFPATRVTVVQNSIDSEQLRKDLDTVSADAIARFRDMNGLHSGLTALFIGGVDPAKGIDFLLNAADEVAKQVPGFRLVIAGEGSESSKVRRRQEMGSPIVYVGRLDGAAKAVALRAADIMMVPEWVGLVAVDSLVSGCPIATTQHPSHSPEFAYLVHDRNALVMPHVARDYANGIAEVLGNRENLGRIQQQARVDSLQYSLASMVRRFAEGVVDWSRAPMLHGADELPQ